MLHLSAFKNALETFLNINTQYIMVSKKDCYLYGNGIEKTVPRDHPANLVMPNVDPLDRFSFPTIATRKH